MKRILSLIILGMSVITAFAQKTEKLENVKVSSSKAIMVGKTKPIKELIRVSSTDRAKKAETKKRVTAAPPNFVGRGSSKAIIPELEHQGVDPIRQKEIPKTRLASIDPSINIDGLFSTFGSPSDPTGDVGLNYYVQAINATDIAVYNKADGSLIDEFAANTLWTPIGESSAGDPIVLFDHDAERWIITEFTHPSGTASLLFAISDTSDPLGTYKVYAFVPPNFPDYPKWAIWNDTYMVTTNELGPGSLHQYFFDRAAFLAGDEEVTMQRVEITGNSSTEAGFYVSTPVSWIGDTAPPDNDPIAVKINDSSWGEVPNDAVEVFTFDIDFDTPANTSVSTTTIETTPFDGYPCDTETGGFACLGQGGSSSGIDAIPEVVMNLPHYRNFGTHESIVLSFITDVADGDNLSGIRWMELRRTVGDWGLYQEGTFAPDDGLHRFMPSISMDIDGNIGLAYNTTSSSEFVGIKYTGRYAEDDLGVMTVAEYNVVEGTGSVSGDRFGDYAQMGIDPVDGRTFWYTSEYAATGGSKTRIVAFKLENPHDLAVESISQPSTGSGLTATESVTVSVKNLGENEATDFDITLYLGETLIETFNYLGTIASKETIEHTFETTIDLSSLEDYEITVEIDYLTDENVSNNSQTKQVSNLVENDVSINGFAVESVCTDNAEVEIEITNEGGATLTSVDLVVYINELEVETINWVGSLETGESANESFSLTGFLEGANTIDLIAINPNEASDEFILDNEVNLEINYDAASKQVKLTINTDEYPEEITWEIKDGEGTILFSGGPYPGLELTTVEEYFCLDDNVCYDLTMRDSEGDGICCDYGEGSYVVTDELDNILVEGNGQYTSDETKEFCSGFVCKLSVEVIKVDAGFDVLGTISIEAEGGIDYKYSIDGGNTFGTNPIFDELEAGTYEVVVNSDDDQCVFEETIEIDYILGLESNQIDGLKVYPNPTDGVFKISYANSDISGFLRIDVVDVNGKILQNHRFSKYDESFEGMISLYAYPNGVYFLIFRDSEKLRMVKVIKH